LGEYSKIEWTTHTFNPWLGCTRVSPACDACYAEAWARRTGQGELWQGERRRTTDANWRKPLRWNESAAKRAVRERVFCASLADVFDNAVQPAWRADLFALIRKTPQLDWLLLTKRIGNARDMMHSALEDAHLLREPAWPWHNVWLGATVVTQQEVERDVPKLLATPARIHFLSCEPLIERIDLAPYLGSVRRETPLSERFVKSIDWVIVGGESGGKARPMNSAWCDEIRQDCSHSGTKFFFKQGSAANWASFKDFDSFPPKLQRREFPA
jgi:protein gp37